MNISKSLSLLSISSALLLAPMPAMPAMPAMAAIDSDSADVTMTVGLHAALTGLDDFVLTPVADDGAAGAVYTGSDTYNLESNGQVRVSLTGSDMSNGIDTIPTSFSLDGGGIEFDTAANQTHNADHTVSATATLNDISDQLSGNYSTTITLTVSAI